MRELPKRLWCIATLSLAACSASSPTIVLPPSSPYTAGQSYFGRNQYIEYSAGNAPIILSAPHGGDLQPAEIPDRAPVPCDGEVVTGTDLNTRETVRTIQQRYHARFGSYPHVIINHLHRRKLDANRDKPGGACGDAEADTAWTEYQRFIDIAKAEVLQAHGKGFFIDMHGHGHTIQRLELGYSLTSAQLDLSDDALNANVALEDTSTIQTISESVAMSFAALMRGPTSLGTLLSEQGFRAIPSVNDPRPSGDPYFSGGYNTQRHGCGAEATLLGGTSGGNICAVQIEANLAGVRDTDASRTRFADALVSALEVFLRQWSLMLN